MNKIKSFGVVAKDVATIHKVEVEVEFEKPITQREAEMRVADAISDYLFANKGGGSNDIDR